ncbi:MAG TPA: nuclear transport factor 2 family protein [Stellaceae bacterium]|nr:nuclear transport factor 2 family protein [Stellaceae bacterium]
MTAETAQILGFEEAHEIVKEVERLFAAADIAGIVAGFTPDAVARFGDFPEMRGRAAIEAFIRARFARQRNYRLEKHLRMVMGDLIGNDWDAAWEDARTGKRMRGRGMEFWRMRGRQIAHWDAVFNVWEEGGAPSIAIV